MFQIISIIPCPTGFMKNPVQKLGFSVCYVFIVNIKKIRKAQLTPNLSFMV